ncbi:hypothetical protein [Rufibacter tibetensis]|uniref:Uncharacterized protein n=1 Tax=Rufibacter tibetensis TaxID=512763 RepID=A0A0P0CM02_9BACT|nr:hypothetical protein [Rufibacter tibetensis]ALJ00711.1 hypothetical protein DC20_19165 [Rufibacter tibetensis]
MEDEYKIEKWVWTEADFGQMGWHDCPVYALRFEDDIYLDLDYILKWNHPGDSGMPYTFWMAPATLVFEQPSYLKMEIEAGFINGFEIADIIKEKNGEGDTIWNIATQEGDIWIGAERFKQILRRPPSFQFGQSIAADERGGVSFALSSEKDYQPSAEILEKKAQVLQQYSLSEQRRSLAFEREQLNKGQLGTKLYLVMKRDLDKKIADIDDALKGTRFEFRSKLN